MILPDTYKGLIKRNPKLECLKWDQYHTYDGNFSIDEIEILGDFTNDELDKCTEDISNFLEDYESLIDLFGNHVTVKLRKLESIEIREIFKT